MPRFTLCVAPSLRVLVLGLSLLVSWNAPAFAQSSIPLSPTAQAAGARITVDKGIEFVTIGSPGNAPWQGTNPPNPNDRAVGRGSVNYEYRIGRFEVTTAQWAEFFTAAYDRPANDRIPHLLPPDHWGAQPAAGVNGGTRYVVPAGNEMRPVGDISWRMAAIYCNWLCNDKRTDRAAFLSGAYDVSTFGGAIFTDQATRSPGAKFFIPTLDEWVKAAHYDPNKNGQGQGGYWEYSITSDTEPVGARPPGWPGSTGRGQVNAGWADGSQYSVPLGAYATVQSSWGLLDTGGATTEWTEEILMSSSGIKDRIYKGSWWTDGSPAYDFIGSVGSEFPSVPIFQYGFRVAAAIPAPSGVVCAFAAFSFGLGRRRFQRAAKPAGHVSFLFAAMLAPLTVVPHALAQSSIPLSSTAQASGSQITIDKGIEFVTIGSPGNAAWQGTNPPTPGDDSIGRGSVNYEYRIGRFEVTTAQWAEFFTAAYDRPANDRIPHLLPPDHWGAQPAPGMNGGTRYIVPAGKEMQPVGDISWRMAAILCNWLSNDKRTDRAAFMSGAYDVSTFGGAIFTDQATRSPGAKFFIPTLDEWLKAAHYDPNKNGIGQGGYWEYSITSDTEPVGARPPGWPGSTGRGQVNAGWADGSQYTVPLGAYATIQSPWGLLDTGGATTEWTEEIVNADGIKTRVYDGSWWTDGSPGIDSISNWGGDEFPGVPIFPYGFRIAAAIPAPSGVVCALAACSLCLRRRRR
jgi:formylglycine-generating enzyme required for sulfatase activity